VEKAKLLLAGGRHSITMIALDCGFASSAYFASVFRNHTQCSPRKYRDAVNKPPANC
jgi:AraC-like DNA-binding protein